jgi:peptidoglycan/LPS O-acetylase OafA/YrhL
MNALLQAFSISRNLRYLVSPSNARFRTIDGLRALAVLWTVIMHCAWFHFPFMSPTEFRQFMESTPVWIVGGPYGVDMFFVISGFLIACLLMNEHRQTGTIKIQRFYGRRFLKLMPAYIAAMGLYAVLIRDNRDMLWTNLIYINNFIPGPKQAMTWTWSLAIEEQFYFTFPCLLLFLFFRIAKKQRLSLLLAVIGCSLLFRAWIILSNDIYLPVPWSLGVTDHRFLDWAEKLYIKPQARLGCLAIGVLAAYLHTYADAGRFFSDRPRMAILLFWTSVLIFAGIVLAPIHREAPPWDAFSSFIALTLHRTLLGTATAYVLLYSLYPSSRFGRGIANVLSLRPFYITAQLGYSAYLIHPMVLVTLFAAAGHSLFDYPVIVSYVLGPALSLAAALVLYLFVERPFMNLREADLRWSKMPVAMADPRSFLKNRLKQDTC